MSSERWLPVPIEPFSGIYEISDRGRLRRSKDSHRGVHKAGYILSAHPDPRYGYPRVSLHDPTPDRRRRQRTIRIHRMVALAFLGPPPSPLAHVRHLDGDPGNCRLENLEWGSSKQNGRDFGIHNFAARASMRRIEATVNDIKRLLEARQ